MSGDPAFREKKLPNLTDEEINELNSKDKVVPVQQQTEEKEHEKGSE